MLNRTVLFIAYVGRNEYRERVFVEVETEPQQHPDAAQTTEHEPVPADNINLRVTYWTLRYRSNRCGSVGSGVSEQLSSMSEIADGWTTADIRSLSNIAKRWHLNDVQGACAHMTNPESATWNRETKTWEGGTYCAEGSGYRYGSAWLTEVIPAEVWTELKRLSELPHGTIVRPAD